jgi:CBS domain-containing protein
MTVKKVLNFKGNALYKTSSDTNLLTAIDSLNYYNVGALMVMEDDGIEGIITERDILRALSKHKGDLLNLSVSDIMTTDLITCDVNDSLETLMDIMTESHIRHLPVLEAGNLVGIISIGDIVESLLHQREREKSREN